MHFCADAIQAWAAQYGTPRALLLGVTPEIYHLPWPAGTDLLAVDHAQQMIDFVWPGAPEAALCADWLDMPLVDGSRDIALLDGGIALLAYPRDSRRLVQRLRAIISAGGLCIFRLFAPPAQQESPDVVLADLLAGRIPNVNVLKLRLGMALMGSAEEGVALATVWDTLHQAAPDLTALAARLGWPVDETLAINAYRGLETRYHFLTADQVTALFCDDPDGFVLQNVHTPSYALGERCPTLVLRRCATEQP